MTRKDPAQDVERPHYYSQFWLDVATGKRGVTEDVALDDIADIEDLDDEEFAAPVAEVVPEKPAPKKASKTDKKVETARPTITSLADLANIDLLMKNSAEMGGDEVPDLESGSIEDLPFAQAGAPEPAIVTDFDLDDAEGEPEIALDEAEDEFADDLDFDEDEEEDEWGAPRKPGKGTKPKPPRRERRPNF